MFFFAYSLIFAISFITSEAITSPATEGTKATLATVALPEESRGQAGFVGISLEYTVLRWVIPFSFKSLRIVRARGQTEV